MKQQEKTQRTRERILAAAIAEFGSKSYASASVNSVCEAGGISKGLLYHNFKGKDDLYLQCVKSCYEEMTAELEAKPLEACSARESLKTLLAMRQAFFSQHPHYANIFFNAVIQPPPHLTGELAQIRRGFDEYLTRCCRDILGCVILREGITAELAMEYITMFQEMFNGYFQKRAQRDGDYRALIGDHEDRLSGFFDIVLYGIARETVEERNGT